MGKPVAITELREGDQGIIHSIAGGAALTSRLAGMGLAAGARFRIAQVSGGLIVVLVADTRIALGRGEASKIMVLKVDPAEPICELPVEKEISVALVGQPNVGKSTIFNILTAFRSMWETGREKQWKKRKACTARTELCCALSTCREPTA